MLPHFKGYLVHLARAVHVLKQALPHISLFDWKTFTQMYQQLAGHTKEAAHFTMNTSAVKLLAFSGANLIICAE